MSEPQHWLVIGRGDHDETFIVWDGQTAADHRETGYRVEGPYVPVKRGMNTVADVEEALMRCAVAVGYEPGLTAEDFDVVGVIADQVESAVTDVVPASRLQEATEALRGIRDYAYNASGVTGDDTGCITALGMMAVEALAALDSLGEAQPEPLSPAMPDIPIWSDEPSPSAPAEGSEAVNGPSLDGSERHCSQPTNDGGRCTRLATWTETRKRTGSVEFYCTSHANMYQPWRRGGTEL